MGCTMRSLAASPEADAASGAAEAEAFCGAEGGLSNVRLGNAEAGAVSRNTRKPSAEDGCRGIRERSAVAPEAARPLAKRLRGFYGRASRASVRALSDMQSKLACERGQGTTEYAILVGVLVVIAILAITVFRPKLEELWQAIANGIQSL